MNDRTKTPIFFPKNKPNTIPRGTGFNKVVSVNPFNDTPAFAKANSGIIPNATYGDSLCSNFNSKESLLTLILCGIVKANITPAMVA